MRVKAYPHRRLLQNRTVQQSRLRLCSTPSTQALAIEPHATKSQAACDKVARLSTQFLATKVHIATL